MEHVRGLDSSPISSTTLKVDSLWRPRGKTAGGLVRLVNHRNDPELGNDREAVSQQGIIFSVNLLIM